jgi:hypothetical protein
MPLRALLSRIVLAGLLMFMQQQAALHELQHGLDGLSGKSNPASPLHEACLQCIAFAGVDNAPASVTPSFALAEFEQPFFAAPVQSRPAVVRQTAYDTRAPPSDA